MKFRGHDLAWGMQQAEDYTEHRYHQPSDEYKPSMDFTADAAMARFGFALGWAAAEQSNSWWKKATSLRRQD